MKNCLLHWNAPHRLGNSTKSTKNFLTSVVLLFIAVTMSVATEKTVVRVGHFPNITHVQGLVAHNLSRQGKGWFEERLGPGVEIQWFTYNAGPSAMEAIFPRASVQAFVVNSLKAGFMKTAPDISRLFETP
jgi:ABC-type nitrate/sulfonate/bicarbonate transport system substrate-binding protein